MKIVAIIQARMTSTRLPGKVMKKVLNKTLLEHQLERVSRSRLIDEIVVATTINETDDVIVDLCKNLNYSFYRGSENNVLSRYYEAATHSKADVIVRLTSDCPLIDPEVIDQVIELFKKKQDNIDYASNTLSRSYPRGMDTEVMSKEALYKTYVNAQDCSAKEHVTSYIYSNPEEFELANLECVPNLSDHRWTVDTEEDFELIKRMIENLYPVKEEFTLQDCVNLMQEKPHWMLLNSHVEQKKV